MRNWVNHRDFLVLKDGIVLNFHPVPGLRHFMSKKQVTELRRYNLGMMLLLVTINMMFLKKVDASLGKISSPEEIVRNLKIRDPTDAKR